MIFITGPLYSGKRTFARTLPGRCITDAQQLAAGCKDNAELEKLADKLSAYDIVWSVRWPRSSAATAPMARVC